MIEEIIVFLEDLKSLLVDLNLDEEEKIERVSEVVEMIDNKMVELEGDLL